MLIEVWVCPDCGDYYGASNAGDLSSRSNLRVQHRIGQNLERWPEETHHSRAECPVCRSVGKHVERIKVPIWIDLAQLQAAAIAESEKPSASVDAA